MIVGDYIGDFSAGHVALIGSNLPHDWVSNLAPGERIAKRDVLLQFDRDPIKHSSAFLPELAELEPLLNAASRGLEFIGTTAARSAIEMEVIGRTEGLERIQHIFALFTLLARAPSSECRPLASEWFSPLLDDEAAPIVDRVLEYIFANIEGDLRMTAAAELAGMTESSFSRFFKRVSGHNFVTIVRKLRITQACRLLRQTTMHVSDISFKVGFRNLSNFNRCFQAEMAMSPGQYRRKHACRQKSMESTHIHV